MELMGPMIASAGAFAAGLMVLASVSPQIAVRDAWSTFKVALLCGALSALLGKLVVAILSVIFLPILLTGPLGVFVLHALFNAILMAAVTRYLDGVRFTSWRALAAVSAALTLLQMIVRANA
jgi:uncharacterized membrane protein YvlD (DUF360 family)